LFALVAVAWSGSLTGDGIKAGPSLTGLQGVLALALMGLGFLYFQSNRLRPSRSSAHLLTGTLIAATFVVVAPAVLKQFELDLAASEMAIIGSLAAVYYLIQGSISRDSESLLRPLTRGWSHIALLVVAVLWIILATIPLPAAAAIVLDTVTALIWSGAGAYIVFLGFRRDDEVVSTLGIACLAVGATALLALAGVRSTATEITTLAAVALAVASAYLDLAGLVDTQRSELDHTREAMRDLAHQARTAITAIEGTLFGLDRRTDLAAEDREALKQALRMELQSLRLMLTRDDPPRLEPVRLAPVIRAALTAAGLPPNDALRWIGPQDMEAIFATGPITEILKALIDNARTHAGVSDVEVEVEQLDRLVEIRVIDRGEGIADSVRHDLFERGVRRHGSPGKGLGLNISRRLARSHGGDLEYRENPGGGSRFVLSVPSSGRVLDLSLYEDDQVVEVIEDHRLPMMPPSPDGDRREARRAGESHRHRDPHPGGEVAGV
jgi:signal transduction histidine kinase